jgi:hypothetical protein
MLVTSKTNITQVALFRNDPNPLSPNSIQINIERFLIESSIIIPKHDLYSHRPSLRLSFNHSSTLQNRARAKFILPFGL